MIALFLTLAVQEAAPVAADTIVRRPVVHATFDVPDQLAPAVVPYMRCALAKNGVRIGRPNDPPSPTVEVPKDCTKEREAARQLADELLRPTIADGNDRARLIEKTLLDADEFVRLSSSSPKKVPSETSASN